MEEILWIYGMFIIYLCEHPFKVGGIILVLVLFGYVCQKGMRWRIEMIGYHLERGKDQARKRGNRNGYK